jgi:hypothetical protein
MEHLILARIKSGWHLKGTIISKIGKRAYTFKYVIYADRLFKTRRVRVSEVTSRSVRNLSIDFIGPAVFVNGKIRAISHRAVTWISRLARQLTLSRLSD